MTGTVTNILKHRGYCFVTGEDANNYFAHVTAFIDHDGHTSATFQALLPNMRVTFLPVDVGQGRLRALDLDRCA